MKQSLTALIVSLIVITFLLTTLAQQSIKDTKIQKLKDARLSLTCPTVLNSIADCPSTGCGDSIDPYFNRQKNITSTDMRPDPIDLDFIKRLPDPVPGFKIGNSRESIKVWGEGKLITLVAYALTVRRGGAESSNCRLTNPQDVDNSIVLVDASLPNPSLDIDEDQSVTAKLTARVRTIHPRLERSNLQPLIREATNNALLVRVTGFLLYDSNHLLHPLKRATNWTIHPVLRLDFCPNGKKCTLFSDSNWKSLDDE